QLPGDLPRTFQSVRELVVTDVRADAPVGALARPASVGFDQHPLAQAPHLVIDQVNYAARVSHPIAGGLLLRRQLRAGVADEYGLIALEDRLQTEVVVDAAVAEDHVRCERWMIQVRTGIRL